MGNDTIRSKSIMLVQLLFAVAFSCCCLYPNFTAQFGLIDDHEIMSYLATNDTFSFGQIMAKLKHTEVWLNNVSSRYRPSYYSLRLIETALWGKSAFCWYAARVAMFSVSVFIAWRLCMRYFGLALGAMVTLVVFSNSYWADIFTRLGPAETYCTVGLALYCLSSVKLWESSAGNSNAWWTLLCFGAVVCMGSKENFLVLLPVTLLLSYRLFVKGKITRLAVFVNSIILAFGTFVVSVITLALLKKGADVYFNPISPAARIKALYDVASRAESIAVFVPFFDTIAFVLIILILKKLDLLKDQPLGLKEEISNLVYAQTFIAGICLFQFVFYNGIWPTEMRYDFPGMAAVDLAFIIMIYSVASILASIYLGDKRWRLSVPSVITGSLLLAYLFAAGVSEIQAIHSAAVENSGKTRKFHSSLLNIIATVKRDPLVPVVLVSNSVWDFEPIYAMLTYFKSNGVTNPAVIINQFPPNKSGSSIEKKLAKSLVNLSEKGGDSTDAREALYPASIVKSRDRYFVITFSGGSRLSGTTICRVW